MPWTPLEDLSQSKLFTPEEIETIQTEIPTAIILQRVSPDGEEGYPGTLLAEFLVGLVQPQGRPTKHDDEYSLGSVVLLYRAKLEEPDKVTPINLTQVRIFCEVRGVIPRLQHYHY